MRTGAEDAAGVWRAVQASPTTPAAAAPGDEEWRPVVGHEGWYEVSSVGRVRRTAPGRRTRSGQVLRPMVSGRQGYPTVSLSGGAGARKRTVPVHTLVAAAFLGPPPPGTRVAHLNLDPLDCRASNLAYLTPSALLIRAGRLRRAAILEHLARVDAALAQEQAAPALLRSRQALEGLRDRLLGVLQDVGAELS